MVDLQLTRALVELILFIELSDDSLVDPDASVAALEQLAATLQGASIETKRTLSDQLRALSKDYPASTNLIFGLPNALGLED